MDVPLRDRGRVARHPEGAAHDHQPAQEPGQGRLALKSHGQVGQWSDTQQGELAGSLASLLGKDVGGMALRQRAASGRQFGIPHAPRTVGLGRDLQRPDQGHGPPERDLDIALADQLEQSPVVLGDLVGLHVAAAAGDGDHLGVVGRQQVQEGQAVVDPRVAVDDDRPARAHPRSSRTMSRTTAACFDSTSRTTWKPARRNVDRVPV